MWGRRQPHKKGIKGGEWVSFLITSISLLNSLFPFPKLHYTIITCSQKREVGEGGTPWHFKTFCVHVNLRKTSAEKKGGAPFHTYAMYLQKVKCWIHLKVYLHYTLHTFRKTGPCIMYLFHNHYSSAKMCTCTSRRSHSVYSHGLKMHIKTWYS